MSQQKDSKMDPQAALIAMGTAPLNPAIPYQEELEESLMSLGELAENPEYQELARKLQSGEITREKFQAERKKLIKKSSK